MFRKSRYRSRILTTKQYRVIELVAQGMKNSEVAQAIGTTEYTIKNCVRSIYDKLGLWNRVELALWYEARKFQAMAKL
jgi:DNA-binding NarL/FixJ family response regulator